MGVSNPVNSRALTRMGASTVRALHELFIAGQVDASFLASAPIRRVVAESWRRSLATGVDPDRDGALSSAMTLSLARMRETHPLAPALPVIRRLLVDDAVDAGVLVAVTAADGTLLWVEGDRKACRKAEAMDFVPGADWSERSAGTNAPGTALALDREVQIRTAEHFSRIVQPWSCSAVPVHDPTTGVLLGAIDLTGGADVATPQTLALVRATVAAVENHLALLRVTSPDGGALPTGRAQLRVLGAQRSRWQFTDQNGCLKAATLTPRHADILVLLHRHPEGLTADHLALLLDDKDLDVVTVRAEMSRLRRVIAPAVVVSRPYRLVQPVDSDLSAVFGHLQAGDVDAALHDYPGALLPQSMSPAVGRIRAELSASMRGAVLATRDVGLLRRWLELPEGRDDRDGWHLLHDLAQAGSVGRARAHGHLLGLDLDLG